MKRILNFSVVLLIASSAQAQWGVKAGVEVGAVPQLGKVDLPRFLIGADHDLRGRWALGADALFWSDDRRNVTVTEGSAYLGAYGRKSTMLSGQLRASYLFNGNGRGSGHAGLVVGVSHWSERLSLLSSPSPASSAPPGVRTSFVTVPVGIRVGVRDEIPGGYFELNGKVLYELGGGGRLFDLGTDHTDGSFFRVGKPMWTLGFGVAYGFCVSGCDDPVTQEARRTDRERKLSERRSKPERPLRPYVQRKWGLRAILLEVAAENSRNGRTYMNMGFSNGFNGVGFDLDVSKRWSLGIDAMIDPWTLSGDLRSDVRKYDGSVELENNGVVSTSGSWLVYEQTGSTYGFNARAAYRFTERRRSSPYIGAWIGVRVDNIELRDPKAVEWFESGGWFATTHSSEIGTVVGGAEMRLTTTHINVPTGLRLGFDLRAGPVYFDLYAYGGARLVGGGPMLDNGLELTSDHEEYGGKVEVFPYHFGTGVAVGLARLKK